MRKSAYFMLALLVGLLAATAALSTPAAAGAVRIQDDAKILSSADRQSITAAAQSAPFAVAVWTSTAYATQAAFNSAVQKATGNNEVAIAVDPQHKYSYTYNRGNTGLTAPDTQQADQAANAQFGQGQWGAGITSAINSMVNASASRGGRTNNTGNQAPANSTNPLPNPSGGFSLGGCGLGLCLIPLLLIGAGAFFFFRNRGMNRNMGAPPPVYPANNYPQQYPQQGPGPGQYPQQGYGPGQYPQQGYGPGQYPQQGSGIGGNIASGGLGALAGGAIGYELGRNAGDHQAGQQGGGFAPGAGPVGGGDFGSGGTFGGDAGGGGQDFGSGGSFGGDAGGGGGGSDAGSGGSFGDSGGGNTF